MSKVSKDSGYAGRSWSWRGLLELASQISLVAASAVFIYNAFSPQWSSTAAQGVRLQGRRPEPPLPGTPVSLEGAQRKGDRRAKIALIEFSDFECPFCGSFARDTLPALEDKYVRSGKLLVAFRHLPLPIHKSAQKAAEAAECAGQQDRFWPMHDLLFQGPSQLVEATLRKHAETLSLDTNHFEACLAGRTSATVQRDAESGRALGITGTPTFLLGPIIDGDRVKIERRISGAQPLKTFDAVLSRMLDAVPASGQTANAPPK